MFPLIVFIVLLIAIIYYFALTKQEIRKLEDLKKNLLRKENKVEVSEDLNMEITGAEIKLGDTVLKTKKITIVVEKED